MKIAITIFSLLAILAPALFAQQTVAQLLDTAAAVPAGDAPAWTAARDAITSRGEAALPELRAAAAEERWTRDGWVRAMAAEACRLRIEKPDTVALADAPEGLKPEKYKLFRKPEPFCQRELAAIGLDAVPLLLERWRWTFEAYAFSAGKDGELERNCFARAIMFVPGNVGDRRARFALEDALRDASLPEGWRQDAAVSFGQVSGTAGLAVLCEVFDDASQAMGARAACGWALGRVPAVQAAEALESRLKAADLNSDLRRALLTGVAILGSHGGWKARGPMMQTLADDIRERCARMAIDVLQTNPEDADLINRALAMTAWPASLDQVRQLAEGSDSEAVRQAAASCVDALKLAIDRNR